MSEIKETMGLVGLASGSRLRRAIFATTMPWIDRQDRGKICRNIALQCDKVLTNYSDALPRL